MNNLLKYINEKTNNEFENYKLANAVYFKNEKLLELKFVYVGELISSAQKQKLLNLTKEFLNVNCKINIKCKKSFLDEDVIRTFVFNYVSENYHNMLISLTRKNIEVVLDEDDVYINLNVVEVFYNHLKSVNFPTNLKEELNQNFFGNFAVSLSNSGVEETVFEENLASQLQKLEDVCMFEKDDVHVFEVSNVITLFGEEITEKPTAIIDVKENLKGFVVAGKIKFLTKRTFQKKKKDSEEVYDKVFYRFVLNDGTADISGVYFPVKADLEKAEEVLVDGQSVVVRGDVENYMEKFSIKVKDISFCELPEVVVEQKAAQNIVFSNYRFVSPTPYVDIKQQNLFASLEESVPEFLKENTCVVFDLETTGLDAQTCEIIEIGAAKIKNGYIVEQFGCFVKPSKEIPAEITELTGITDDMVKDAKSIGELIPDFYKFCNNSVIIAHNLDFDYKFLYMAGRKVGYDFNNKRLDTLALARNVVKGVKNYKLKTLANHFNVSLENAHRAVHDATATAEVFIKIAGGITDALIQQ